MSEKTIQQQLQDFAANPVVDGVRWEANYYEGLVDGFSTFICGRQIHIYPILDTGEESIFSKWNLNAIKIFGMPMLDKELTASTPAEACREALRICRERVAELAVALGVECELKAKVKELFLFVENNGMVVNGYRSMEIVNQLRELINEPTGAKKDV